MILRNILFKTSLQGSFLTAIACFLLFVGLHFTGFFPLQQHRFLYFPIYLAGILLTIKYFRDNLNHYELKGWQGILMGLLINFFTALFYSVLVYSFLRMNPNLLAEYQNNLKALAQAGFEKAQEESDKNLYKGILEGVGSVSVGEVSVDIWFKTSLIGFVMAMGSGVFMKRTL
ncbi:MAG: DUF4199 domain-containing protein [Bacteroidetes bacterium]|nr:MAG: DUF4199 domain-containing protein [Bacteroidota bacterium]